MNLTDAQLALEEHCPALCIRPCHREEAAGA